MADWLLFAGLMAFGQFSPGPDMILLTRVSLKNGCGAGFRVVLGIVTGLCFHAALAIGGMSALLAQGDRWEQVLSVLAAGYLAWLGWQMVSVFVSAQFESVPWEASEGKDGNWFLKGLLCNLLNPKVVIFFAGLTALFLQGPRVSWWPYLLWATIVIEGLVLWGLWVVLLQKRPVRDFYRNHSRWFDLGFGLALWLIALLLLHHAFTG